MSGWLPEGTHEWHGRPVARRVTDAAERGRAALTGTVRSIVVHRGHRARGRVHPMAHAIALDAWLDDGTGTITLRWLGREAIAGLAVGARLSVEGTVMSESARLLILNPLYRFVPTEKRREATAPTEDRAGSPAELNGRVADATTRQPESSTS